MVKSLKKRYGYRAKRGERNAGASQEELLHSSEGTKMKSEHWFSSVSEKLLKSYLSLIISRNQFLQDPIMSRTLKNRNASS